MSKFNFCPECGSKTPMQGTSPPKFCCNCGHSFYKGAAAKVVNPTKFNRDNEEDDERESIASFKHINRNEVKIETYGRRFQKISDLSSVSEIDGPRNIPSRNVTPDEFKKIWASDAGVSKGSFEIGGDSSD